MKQNITSNKSIKFFFLNILSFSFLSFFLLGCGGGGTKNTPLVGASSADKTAPVLTLVGSAQVTLKLGAPYVDTGATASDDKDGDITDKIVIDSTNVDTSNVGSYIVTYNVSDTAGNKAVELSRTVKVLPEGEEPPVVFKSPWDHGALKVVANEKMLQHEDGEGFFWMADTAWFLYKKNKTEIDLYMNDRAAKKFTVIQAVAAHTHASYRTPNYNDERKFDNAFKYYNITTPNEEYWKHIDYMVKKAEEKGMYVALLPVWRDAMKEIKREDVERTFATVNDAREYGRWIATRYKNSPNIIWLVGGDAPLDNKFAGEAGMSTAEQIKRWNALGEGIKSVGAKQLRAFHPGPSVKKPYEALGKKNWMDFNMIQSSRFGPVDSLKDIKVALTEGLPAVDGESLYEDLAYPREGESARRTAFQIREDAYSQLFAGAFGNTYGHDAIWRFCVSVRDNIVTGDDACGSKATFLLKPKVTWKDALNATGGKQMQYVTELMLSRPIVGRKADQSLLQGSPEAEEGDRIVATLGVGYAMVYTPHGKSFTVVMGKVSGAMVKAWWYNTRDGTSIFIGEFTNNGTREFTRSDTNDWVLILDDSSKGYGTPGK